MSKTAKPGAGESVKMARKAYEKELRKLQVELCHVQDWVKANGRRIVILFEGRDAAGKGGTIKAITERVSPRVFRVVALPAPTDREKTQMYVQRYIEHFPAAGEIVIFDRSWYNRAGVEHVMGFCQRQGESDFSSVPGSREIHHRRRHHSDEISGWRSEEGTAERRFLARINDPLRQWKLSPMDLESYRRWYDYSRARDEMLERDRYRHAPWHIVRSDDKKRARLNCIAQILDLVPYKKKMRSKVKLAEAVDERQI